MSKEQMASCNQTGGCVSVQVMRRDIEHLSSELKESMRESKECIDRSNEAQKELAKSVLEAKMLIDNQAQMIREGDVKFSKINNELDTLKSNTHYIDTRVSVMESGGKPINSNVTKWSIGIGGVGSVLAWAASKLFNNN